MNTALLSLSPTGTIGPPINEPAFFRRILPMLERRELFPHVIEMNYQARRRMGCCVYLVYDEGEWLLIDIGYEDTVREIIDLIRQLDFPLSQCKYLVVTHAD